MSIRQKTEDILKENPNISISELQVLLDEINPGSAQDEFGKLKQKLNEPVLEEKPIPEPKEKPRKKSVQRQVSEYLDKNTEASFGTLKSLFPGIKPGSLGAYKCFWKKEQDLKTDKPDTKKLEKAASKQTVEPLKKLQQDKVAKPGKTEVKKELEKPAAKQAPKPAKMLQPDKVAQLIKKTGSDSKELIDSLKKTIDAQDQTIQTIKSTTHLLVPKIDEEELQGLTFADVKRIAVTFLKSIKELPAKMRR
ncbi:MAG: hypothetical protein HQ517_08475 [SAR324 cluster bacterium]|nr:hypothetical protein [SAR324 cluster bacterium]